MKKTTNIIFCILIICLTALTAIATPSDSGVKLSGVVTDQEGAVVKGAVIHVSSADGQSWAGTTGADGRYQVAGIRPGTYLIEVEAAGFSRRAQQITVSTSAASADVVLSVAGVNDEIVITSSGTPELADQASKALTVVDGQDAEHRGTYSLIDALRDVPGVRTEQLGGPGAFSKIFIRGLRVVDTSLLVDGIRVRDASDFHGSINPFLGDLMMNGADRVEVLRGSGSSLYGANAVGGVLNLVPVEGAGAPQFTLSFEGGSLGTFREQAQVSGGVKDRLGYSVSATRLDVNNGVTGLDVYRNTSVLAHGLYHINDSMSVRATFLATHGFGLVDDSPFPIGPAGNAFGFALGAGPVVGFIDQQANPDSFRYATMLVGSVVFSHQVNNFFNYSVSYQGVSTSTRFDNGPDQSTLAKQLLIPEFPGITDLDGRIDTLNATGNIAAGRHNLITAGLEYEHESLTQDFSSPFFSNPRTTDRQSSLAVFGQDQVTLGRLQLLASVRTEGFTINNPESVPGITGIPVKRALIGDGAVAYMLPSSGTKFRAHVGNSFRAPSLSERFSFFQGQRIGNPFLRPERGISVDGGIDQSLFHNHLRLGATYFYQRLQEVIVSTALFQQLNSKGALSRGLETSLTAAPYRGLEINASYTFTNSQTVVPVDTFLFGTGIIPGGASIQSFSIPRHAFSLDVNQALRSGFNLNLNLYHASEHTFSLFDPVFFSEVIFPFKSYTNVGARVSYSRHLSEKLESTFYVTVNNIGNETIFTEGFRNPGRTAYAGVKFHF